MSSLPPLVSSGVFNVATSCTIDAPIDHVWSVLIDFPAYKEWNPFVRSQLVTDGSGNPLPDQTARPGSYISMETHLPATMEPIRSPQSTRCLVTVIDHDNYRAAWVYDVLPRWLLCTERWQTLSFADGKTKYETREVFGGVLAYIVMFFFQAKLKLSFDAMGVALKERAERST